MDFFKKQPIELSEDELHENCSLCNVDMDISMKQSTTFRGEWYHVWCWRKLVGI